MENKDNIEDGNDLTESLYGEPSKKRKKRIKKVEKVEKPDHWHPDFDANELKRKQQNNQTNGQ